MKNIYHLANEFQTKLEKTAAGRLNRKQLEKSLAQAKLKYTENKNSLSQHEGEHERLSALIEKEQAEVTRLKDEIIRTHNVLQHMDLNDINEVKMFNKNNEVGYVKNKRLFRLDENQALVPFKKKKKEEDEEEEEDLDIDLEDDAESEDELDADDLLASLVN